MNDAQIAALDKAREIVGEHFTDIVFVGRTDCGDSEYFHFITSCNHFTTLGLLEAAKDQILLQIDIKSEQNEEEQDHEAE